MASRLSPRMPLPPRRVETYSVPVERDAEGFPLCRQCKTSIRTGKRPKQRTFCDDKNCLHLWKIKSDPSYAATHVALRDKGVCAACGTDTASLRSEFRLIPRGSAQVLWLGARGLPLELLNRHRWFDVDHVVPVVEGGGSCGLDNLRTLCLPCHKVATARLAARLAQARRAV